MFSHILCGLEVTVIYRLFCGKVAEQKKLRKLTNADLAKMTGYRKKSIEAFMCGARESEAIAKALAAALNIEL
jgi:transcriptional regulator with XRE-family HTH domain